MSFQWPVAKLDLINSALTGTGDNIVTAADDGSDEWLVCSSAYETALAYIMESHSWGFSTAVSVLQPSPTAPVDTAWDTAYPLPADLVHLIWVRINQNQDDPTTSVLPQPVLYDILGGQLVVNSRGGPPPPADTTTPAQITIKYVTNNFSAPEFGTPTFVLALQTYVMSSIYRSLHEDPTEADNVYKGAEAILQAARTRYDQQKPKRSFFNSRMTASRRVRRPWPPTGNDTWGGTGIPS